MGNPCTRYNLMDSPRVLQAVPSSLRLHRSPFLHSRLAALGAAMAAQTPRIHHWRSVAFLCVCMDPAAEGILAPEHLGCTHTLVVRRMTAFDELLPSGVLQLDDQRLMRKLDLDPLG